MRSTLKTLKDERKTFRAQFVRIGKKTNFKGYSEETILLKDVTDVATGIVVTDHLWFTLSKAFEKIIAKEGIWIEFDARVTEYKKGYVRPGLKTKKSLDYKLSHPTKVKEI